MANRALALVAMIGMTFLVFGIWPGLDLAISGYFYDASGFPVRRNPVIEAMRNAVWDATLIMPALALLLLPLALLLRRKLLLTAKEWGFVLLLFLLGPGLLVNGILKAHWGRARPSNVIDFGGKAQFTPAYEITDQCAKNCSFVSGEGAGTMALTITALLILFALRSRLSLGVYRLGQVAAWAVLLFVGWQRVAAGGHFLSDVLLSWLFVALMALGLQRVLLGPGSHR